MAAGLAGLTALFTPEAAERLTARGEALKARVNGAAEAAGAPVRMTGFGSMLGLHPTDAPIVVPEDVPDAKPARALLHLALLARGLYIARRGYVSLSLPQDETDDDAFAAAVADALAQHGRVLRDAA